MKFLHLILAKILGRNLRSTPTSVIADQLLEPRPLPMGRKEFHEWSDRIIGGALIPHEGSDEVHAENQKFALADMVMHLGPTESHKPDAFFIHSLRKVAVNQVCWAIRTELHASAKARTAKAEEEAAKLKLVSSEKPADETLKG